MAGNDRLRRVYHAFFEVVGSMIKGYFYADNNMPITQMVFDNATCYDEWHKAYEKDNQKY